MASKKAVPGHQRQGDCLFLRIKEAPADVVPAKRAGDSKASGVWIASGESSGHEHRVFGGAKLFAFRDTTNASRVLVVGRAGAEVRVVGGGSGGVPRHHPVMLAPGAWEVRLQRTWSAADEARSRQVQD